MKDKLTPLQKELQAKLFTLTTLEDIKSFVAKDFPVDARRRTLALLGNGGPMDYDYIDWQGVVDFCIRKYL